MRTPSDPWREPSNVERDLAELPAGALVEVQMKRGAVARDVNAVPAASGGRIVRAYHGAADLVLSAPRDRAESDALCADLVALTGFVAQCAP